MPLIRPISHLRNRANEISELCHSEDKPVFVAKNGSGDSSMDEPTNLKQTYIK